MRKLRAFVTGSSGFIGSHLVRHLVANGYEVHALTRQRTQDRPEELAATYPFHGATEEVLAAVEAAKPDVTFHLASLFLASHTAEQVAPLVDSNVLLGTQLLEALAQQPDPGVFVNAGTAWQFFHSQEYRPVNLYAATKQAFEAILAFYADARNLRCATLHIFDSYGPGDTRRKLVPVLLEALRSKERLSMNAGDLVIDLAHVDDICRAFLHAADGLRNGSMSSRSGYAVSGGPRRTLREVVATFEQAAGQKLDVEWGVRPYREREVMHPWDGPTLPGWSPEVSLEHGLAELLRTGQR